MLRLNGYSTAAFGKYHETAPWEVSVSGPVRPLADGFGLRQSSMASSEVKPISSRRSSTTARHRSICQTIPDYHFTTDMTNQAITWVRSSSRSRRTSRSSSTFATGATHAPHHVPADWVDRYKGKFDDGWDAYREQTLARQINWGSYRRAPSWRPSPADIADWDTLSADEKRLYARQMEVFAAFAEHTDHEVGRLADAIEAMGEMDNTLFIYVFR